MLDLSSGLVGKDKVKGRSHKLNLHAPHPTNVPLSGASKPTSDFIPYDLSYK
jgi:hypothetical protein